MLPRPDPREESEKIDRLRRAMYSRELSPRIHEHERHTLDSHENEVGEDWVQEDEAKLKPSRVAPRSIGTVRTLLWWFLASAIIFFLGAVAFFIWFFTFGSAPSNASASNIDIVVTGPPAIAGGDVTELQISITNKNSVPLSLAELTVSFPPGTRSPTDFTTPQLTYPINLGTIQPGETKEGTMKAVLSGNEGQKSDVKVELDYHLSGSSATFTADSDYAFTFSSSPLSIAVSGVSEAISGQPLTMTVTVASNSNDPIKDVLLSVPFPFGFQFTSSAPTAVSPGLWNLGTLNPGEKQTVTINGVLTGNTGDDRVFNFTTGTRSDSASTTIDVPLGSSPFDVAIAQPFMGLTLSVNDSASSPAIVVPGQGVHVSIAYKNNLTTPITDAVVVAKISGVPVDGQTVLAPTGFYRSNDNTVLWNNTTTGGDLGTLAPGATGELSFSFTAPNAAALQGVADPSIGISVDAAGNRVDQSGVPQNLDSVASSNIILASKVALTAVALYHSSPYGSTGPLPPMAGSETDYAMVFTLTNTTNQIDNAVITATLPPYVRSTGKQSPSYENLKFNLSKSTVTWNAGTVAANVGTNGTLSRQVAFEVAFAPSMNQIGQSPALLQNITLTGTDDTTGQPVTISVPDVTTNLTSDSKFNSIDSSVTAPGTAGTHYGFVVFLYGGGVRGCSQFRPHLFCATLGRTRAYGRRNQDGEDRVPLQAPRIHLSGL